MKRVVLFPLAIAWLACLNTAVPAQDRSTPLPSHFPLGVEACFGRVYDANHLRANPRQRVTSFHLFRNFTPDPATEEEPQSRDELIRNDGENGYVSLTGYVRLRDRRGIHSNHFGCSRDEKGVVRCGIDCDGGSFTARPSGRSLIVENQGFVVVGGCGGSEEDMDNPVFVAPGTDDRVFRLDRQPLAQCVALREAQAPAWARLGPPLRERFARQDTLCLSRSYDAAHLAAHPRQSVRRIAVLKTAGAAAKDAPQYDLKFKVELKNGQTLEGHTNCWPENYAYACTHDAELDTQRSFYMTRAGDSVMLRDQRGSLGALLKTELGTDDRLFRLQPSPDSACSF